MSSLPLYMRMTSPGWGPKNEKHPPPCRFGKAASAAIRQLQRRGRPIESVNFLPFAALESGFMELFHCGLSSAIHRGRIPKQPAGQDPSREIVQEMQREQENQGSAQ